MPLSAWRPLAIAVLLAGTSVLLHPHAARHLAPSGGDELPTYFLPQGASLRPFTMGHATTVSDLYWLRMVQYIGTEAAQRAGWPQLLQLGELVTELDPLHGYAYEVTGLLLSSRRRLDEADRIYDRGRAASTGRWQLPFYQAFNEYFERRNYRRGGELLAEAARLPGRPAYVAQLASRLLSTSGEVELALAFIDGMLLQENLPDQVREDLLAQRFGLQIERDIQQLEAAVARFEERTGARPQHLAELVGELLPRLPLPPAGSEWTYDPATGKVRSSIQDERLRYVHPDDWHHEDPP